MRTEAAPDPLAARARLFVAVPVPDSVREDLSELAEPHRGVTWIEPGRLHLTLRFIGEVPEDRIGPVGDALAPIRVGTFILPVEGVGAFPPRGPARVLWAGVGSGHPHLFQLRQRVDDALLAAGVDLDVRVFLPHISVARCSDGAGGAVASWLHRRRDFAGAPFRAASFGLFRSRLPTEGAPHELLRSYPLA